MSHKWLITAVIWFLLIWKATPQVSAQTIYFEDQFEDDQKWQLHRGNWQYWSFADQQVTAYIPDRFIITELAPKDEYWDSNITDFQMELDFTPLEGVDKNIGFNVIDSGNYYDLHLTLSSYDLVRISQGKAIFHQIGYPSLPNGQTTHLKLVFEAGQIKLYFNRKLVGEFDDSSFTNQYGKVSLKASTGSIKPTKVVFDNLKVSQIHDDPDSLEVPFFSQADARWKSQEYDTAGNWSDKPSIGRWGCALSSLAMVMKYHGLTQLPDGSALDPGSLNSWLKSQPDGYDSLGYLSWIAATRLTRLISERYGTPKLEFSRNKVNPHQAVLDQLTKLRPAVLQIAGHFLVGKGTTPGRMPAMKDNQVATLEPDLLIADPAYPFQQFSQHQTELLSTLIFTPSFTDLSYLVVTASPELDLRLMDVSENQVPGFTCFTDTITDGLDNSGEATPAHQSCYLAKPSDGVYLLSAQAPHPDQAVDWPLTILAYDQQANPTIHQDTINSSNETTLPQVWKIDYHRDQPSVIDQVKSQANPNPASYSWLSFQQDLDQARQSGNLTSAYAYLQLSRVVNNALAAPIYQQSRYCNLLAQKLTFYTANLTESGRRTLSEKLALLRLSSPPKTD